MIDETIIFTRTKGNLVVNGWVVTTSDGQSEQCVTIAHKHDQSWFAMSVRRDELLALAELAQEADELF